MASAAELKSAFRSFSMENDRFDLSVARKHGIAPADLHALEHLEFAGGLTPGQLGERLQLSSGAITALVDRLERAGWVQRLPHPSDRRSSLLCLTDRAQRFAAEAYAPFGRDMARVAARLSAAERQVVTDFLSAAAAVAAEHARVQASSASSSEGSVTGRWQAKPSHT